MQNSKNEIHLAKSSLLFLITVLALFCGTVQAKTIGGIIDPSGKNIECQDNDPKLVVICEQIMSQINTALSGVSFNINGGGILYRKDPFVPVQEVPTGHACTHLAYVTAGSDLVVKLNAGGTFTLSFEKLSDPIILGTKLPVNVFADIPVREWFGVNLLGHCNKTGEDNYVLEMNVNLDATIAIIISLEPSVDINAEGDYVVEIKPKLFVESSVPVTANFQARGQNAIFNGFMNLANSVISFLAAAKINRFLKLSDYSSDQFLVDLKWAVGEIAIGTGLGRKKINEIINDLIASRVEAETPNITSQLEDELRQQLATALGLDAEGKRSYTVQKDLANFVVTGMRRPLKHVPVYENSSGSCLPADIEGVDVSRYFSDSACSSPVDFRPQTFTDYLFESAGVRHIKLGDPAQWRFPDQKWTPSIGSTINLGVEPIEGKYMPYFKRIEYRQVPYIVSELVEVTQTVYPPRVPGEIGRWIIQHGSLNPIQITRTELQQVTKYCKLEMRVYKKNIVGNNLKPLLAIHGGNWKNRSVFTSLESEISHFTDAGYIVFTPFYQQTTGSDVMPICQKANWQSITQDLEAALQWVVDNGASYGMAAGEKVSILGQSAGANLAQWLMVNKPGQIEKGLLMYPPTDTEHFVQSLGLDPGYSTIEGTQAVADYLGLDLSTAEAINAVDLNSPAVQLNSFPKIVEKNSTLFPPVYIIHGAADGIVPYDQSLRLCAAYSGNKNSLDGRAISPPETRFDCGIWGKLQLLSGLGHGLDVCIPGYLCSADTAEEKSLVIAALSAARAWLMGIPPAPVELVISNTVSSTAKPYAWAKLSGATPIYIDRNYLYKDFPVEWEGMDVLQTANNDKALAGADTLRFDVNQDVTVRVIYDVRYTVLPDWLVGFEDSGIVINGTAGEQFKVFRRDFPAGTVSLGGNLMGLAAGAASNYTVLVAPKEIQSTQNTAVVTVSNTLASSANSYQWDNLAVNKLFYTDRNYVYRDFPAAWTNSPVLVTPNDDKYLAGAQAVSFNVDRPVVVYILYDDRYTTLPAWLNAFTRTGLIVNGDFGSLGIAGYQVFSRRYAAGTINLGGNMQPPAAGAESNYTVVVQAQ